MVRFIYTDTHLNTGILRTASADNSIYRYNYSSTHPVGPGVMHTDFKIIIILQDRLAIDHRSFQIYLLVDSGSIRIPIMNQCFLAERTLHFLYHGSSLCRSLRFRMLYANLLNGCTELGRTRHSLGRRCRRGLRNKSRRRRHMSGNDLLAGESLRSFPAEIVPDVAKEGRIVRYMSAEPPQPGLLEQGALARPVGGYRLNQPFFFHHRPVVRHCLTDKAG